MAKSFSSNPSWKSWKSWIIGLGVVLFGVMGYFGYRFISEAERSASGIQSNIEPRKELNLKDLESSSPAYSVGAVNPVDGVDDASDVAPNETVSVSSGQDIQIEKGEFSYVGGQPKVQLLVKNTGQLSVDLLHINLNLLLNQEKQAVAKAQAIEIKFPQTLLAGESMKIDVPIAGEAWTTEAVVQAEKRRIQAKIVSVSVADGQDYPQKSGSVVLSQVANDWGLPSDIHQENHEDKLDESDKLDKSDKVDLDKEQQTNEQNKPDEADVQALENHEVPDEVRQFLDADKLPEKNEAGIISHEYKEFQK